MLKPVVFLNNCGSYHVHMFDIEKKYFQKVIVVTNNTLKQVINFIKISIFREINSIVLQNLYLSTQLILTNIRPKKACG